MLPEIKLLVKSEADKALKKQKEEFDSAFSQLEKGIIKLENEKDDVEQYARPVCLRVEDVPVANEKIVEERHLRKLKICLKTSVLIYLVTASIRLIS